jgi:hypothetical protein
MNKGIFSIIGYLLFAIGMIALILSLIGLKLSLLSWADTNPAVGLMIKLGLIMVGLIILYVSKLNNPEQ